jgi:hypothetical protein
MCNKKGLDFQAFFYSSVFLANFGRPLGRGTRVATGSGGASEIIGMARLSVAGGVAMTGCSPRPAAWALAAANSASSAELMSIRVSMTGASGL